MRTGVGARLRQRTRTSRWPMRSARPLRAKRPWTRRDSRKRLRCSRSVCGTIVTSRKCARNASVSVLLVNVLSSISIACTLGGTRGGGTPTRLVLLAAKTPRLFRRWLQCDEEIPPKRLVRVLPFQTSVDLREDTGQAACSLLTLFVAMAPTDWTNIRRYEYFFPTIFHNARQYGYFLTDPPRQEKEAREQQELNELADSDPAEYDRRIKEWHKRKIEGRDGTSSSLGGDAVDHTESGDLERRKSLARERRSER